MTVKNKVFIIAEIGVNHNGSVQLACELIDAATKAGADAVKFQAFRAQELTVPSAPKAAYQKITTGNDESQMGMLQRLQLKESDFSLIARHCQEKHIEFLCSPFDLDSLTMLLKLGIRRIKLGSGEITNAPLLLEIGRSKLPVLLSTGMSFMGEVEEALGVLAYGATYSNYPTRKKFLEAFLSDEGQKYIKAKVILLHCTTEYPAPFEEVNLSAMDTMQKAFLTEVGFSDHTTGIAASLAAAARGACCIEKHFTLDRDLPGPDHQASLMPMEFAKMVEGVRAIETALGTGIKVPSPAEQQNRLLARRCIVASRNIRKGESFSLENITCKRPGTGLSPMEYWSVLGRLAHRDYEIDEEIEG